MNGVEKSKQSGRQAETARSKQSPQAGANRSSKCAIEPAKAPAGGEKPRRQREIAAASVPPETQKSKCRHTSKMEREKRRWIADTIRDIFIAILGGLISLTVSLLLLTFG